MAKENLKCFIMGTIKENYEFYEWLRVEKGIRSIGVIEAMEYLPEFEKRNDKKTIYDQYINKIKRE